MDDRDLDALAALAQRLADAAAPIALRYFRQPVAVDVKPDHSPVTIADRECEAAMRAILAREVPSHGIYGEEHGLERVDAHHVWVLDPIDGTRAFITGRPLFGTLIALCRDGVPVLGICDCAALGERWIGVAGQPTLYHARGAAPRPARTRPCAGLSQALLGCCSPYMFKGAERAAFDRLAEAVRSPLFGGDCFNYGQVASGYMDLVVEASLKPFDFAALVPILEGAGGLCTDWQGRALRLDSEGDVIAAGDKRVHGETVRLLAAR
jgi:inositol-phosphate phosphatase/L-galactose 1-phosphate phosphatase/histidinol-phosphatase